MDFIIDTVSSSAIYANAAENLVRVAQSYIGPILLFIIGCIAIGFLWNRQPMQFAIFALIAIVVAIFFYAPGIIVSIATAVVGESGISTGSGGGLTS